jgi:hypothetical protein
VTEPPLAVALLADALPIEFYEVVLLADFVLARLARAILADD